MLDKLKTPPSNEDPVEFSEIEDILQKIVDDGHNYIAFRRIIPFPVRPTPHKTGILALIKDAAKHLAF